MTEIDKRAVRYRNFSIIHSPGTPHPRLNDSFVIVRYRDGGGDIVEHVGAASEVIFRTEDQALFAAGARGKMWIDENMST